MSEEERLLRRWMRGNEYAVRFCQHFFYACHLWDDLIDGDKRTADDIDSAFWMLFVEIPENPFYQAYRHELQPLIKVAINQWHIANQLERSGDTHKEDISYTLRCSILGVIEHCTYLVGGYPWMRQIAHEVRLFGQRETLEEYREDLKNA